MWRAQQCFVIFRKFDFFHTLRAIFVLSDYRKCMKELRFLKSNKGLLCTDPDLQIDYRFTTCSFFKFFRVTFSKGEVANIFNKQELVDSVSPYKRLIFPLPCPDYPSCR